MTISTTKLQDYLGRWLTNSNPGTSGATDSLGRSVKASDKDYLGRALQFTSPSAWAQSTAYTTGTYTRLSGGQILLCSTSGTSGASAPTAPSTVGGTVTDGTAHWTRIH